MSDPDQIYNLTKTQLDFLIKSAVAKAVAKITTKKSKRERKHQSEGGVRHNPVIDEQKKVYDELRSEYRRIHKIDDSVSDDAIRKQAKAGSLPTYPSYPDALKEYSRRRSEADPEHARKVKAREANLAKYHAEKAKTKSDQNKSEASSIVSEPSVPQKKILKVAKKNPTYEIIVANQTDDPEEYNRILKVNGKTYAMNSLNHVANMEAEWIGIWDGEKIIECDQSDED